MTDTSSFVATGSEGWLFLKAGSNRNAEQLAGVYPLPKDFDDEWRDLLTERRNQFEKLGIRYLFFVAPAKEVVYAAYLPADLTISDDRPIRRVQKAAAGLVDMIYPVDSFVAASASARLYAQNDTHWTADGTVFAYHEVIAALGMVPLAREMITTKNGIMNDLGSKIGRENPPEPISAQARSPRHRIVENNEIKPLGNRIVTEVDDPDLPTAVIFRDSFLTHGIYLYAQHFRRMVVVWQPNIDWSLIAAEKPNYVVSELAERDRKSVV